MATRQPGDTFHTVQIRNPPSATLRFIVGVSILYAVWSQRALIAGWIFRSYRGDDGGGMESVTGIVLPLAIDFVLAVGSFGIFAASFGWSVLADVAGGIYATIANWSTKQQVAARVADAVGMASRAALNVAGIDAGAKSTTAAFTSATDAAGNASGPPASPEMDLAEFMNAVQSTLREQRDQIAEINARFSEIAAWPTAAGPPTAPNAPAPRRGRPAKSPTNSNRVAAVATNSNRVATVATNGGES